MFWFTKKKMESRFKDQNERIYNLELLVQNLCSHGEYRVDNSYDQLSMELCYHMICVKCEKLIDIVDRKEANEIIKQQEIKKAKKLLKID